MGDDIKKGIKKMAKNAEVKVAESVLKWKYKREGKTLPEEEDLDQQSRFVADRANTILSKRGKSVWTELKKGYQKMREEMEKED